MRKLGTVCLLVFFGIANGVFAAGLAIPEQGAAAMGMSAAMTARSEDLSSLYYNPAGLDYVERNEAMLGMTPIRPSHTYEGSGVTVNSAAKTYIPPQLYFAHRSSSRLVLGLGIYTPFGLGTDWNPGWTGRYTSTFAEVQTMYFNPTASFKVTNWLSLGAGFSFVYSRATIEKMIDSGLQVYSQSRDASAIANPRNDSKFSLEGEGGGTNWNVGAMLRPIERMQIGLAYRSETNVEYEGEASFSHPSHLAASLSTAMPALQNGKTTLNLPSTISVGLLYDLTERWDASFDANFTNWSSYDKLVIELDKKLPVEEITQRKDWDNTTTFRLGTSFDMNELTVLRGGALFDQSPVPDNTFDAQLPDSDRIGLSLGFGRKVGTVNLDFSYLFLMFSDHKKNNYVGYADLTDTFPPTPGSIPNGVVDAADQSMLSYIRGAEYPAGNGTYGSNAHLFSVAASIRF